MQHSILVKGARVNNLKNIDLEIPRDRFIVVTGLSGSGKSSLAFDTLYAEGQRRYVESLSAYARQFLGRMHKPECDYIKGLPPAIAIEQKVTSRNPRSTVGTSTEIYEYLRLLFARIGRTYSPVSGEEVHRHSADDVVEAALRHTPGTRFTVLAPLRLPTERSFKEHIEILMQQGLSRLDADGQMLRMDEAIESEAAIQRSEQALAAGKLFLLIDRLVVDASKEGTTRLTDSVETALFEGDGQCFLRFYPGLEMEAFSTRFEADGISFEQPSDNLFSFNSPQGACPRCEGFGRVVGIDESLVVPNTSLSIYDGAVMCWRGEKMGVWQQEFMRRAQRHNFPIFDPYYTLTDAQRDLLWHGGEGMDWNEGEGQFCIDDFFRMLEENQYKIQNRVMLARYRGKTQCPACQGSRLRPEALYVRVGGATIAQLVKLPVGELTTWFDELQLNEHDQRVATRLLTEIRSRLHFLLEVGLGYLTLDRLSNSLSGGESQRINLATSLGSSLVGSLYILDEPSIGLHSRDTERLIRVLHALRDLGNTVVVVEHDEDIMRAADHLIDIGPDAGRLGGEVVWNGRLSDALKNTSTSSHTLRYLTGQDKIEIPATRRAWNRSITIRGARHHNLKGIDVEFPLNVFTVVTGVSGSGKSTLVRDIFYPAMQRELNDPVDRPGEFASIEGDTQAIQAIDFIDQNPIGRSTRSNPVTYIKAYDDIRKLMAEQPLAKQLEMTPAFFSFNTDGGRCEECKGDGVVHVEMQFMADLELECESCHGKRFKSEVLDVKFHDCNIYDILDMTVNQAIEFFDKHGKKKIAQKLRPLQDVGLGYIKLGQSSSTLSGGENQRVKLAYYLGQERAQPTLFIFDEPTTGLHFHDIHRLLQAFNALIERGHTLVVIEHNLDVVKTADHIIDLGPEGGMEGGHLVFAGTPEALVASGRGYTGRYLASLLEASR
ncbi:MAG: excinuclease ABC subunit UvrA [Bacteroidales bacterium]|nr:excinuclease ABC subunit UvrA [Bacteroidales bacterium]